MTGPLNTIDECVDKMHAFGKKLIEDNTRLKGELAEARELLESAISDNPPDRVTMMIFLAKHTEGK